MVIRLLAVATAFVLGTGLAQSREAVSPKAQPSPAASTVDPLEVPKRMHDWFAKSVDEILTDEDSSAEEKPRKAH